MKPILIIAGAGLALAAAGCGGSSASKVAQLGSSAKPGASSPAALAQGSGAIAFSRCMRSHGVPKFPDPAAGGVLPKIDMQGLGVRRSTYQSANSACQHLLGSNDVETSVTQCLSSGVCAPELRRQIMTEGLAFARCMRSDGGVPNWPDPTRYPENGAPIFNLLRVQGFDPRSTQIEHKMDACSHVYSPGIRVGLARP